MEFKIEKNIPLPERDYVHNYPFGEMEIGDSFAFKTDGRKAHDLRLAMGLFHKLSPKRFISKDVGREIRIWRVQ